MSSPTAEASSPAPSPKGAEAPLRIAHLASLHCGEPTFDRELIDSVVGRVDDLDADLVVVAGDLTASGYEWEYAEAERWLARIRAPQVVALGNHDSRNVGYVHYEQRWGDRFGARRIAFDDERARAVGAGGVTVVHVDSSEPDLDEGRIGREWYDWIRGRFAEPADLKVFVLHHHLVAVPGTGRDLNHVIDAGDVLPILTDLGVDVVLTGHRHVPYFWGLNGVFLANAGTASSRRTRGMVAPSFNELVIDRAEIRVFVHYPDGRRILAAVRKRSTRRTIREAFTLTDAFRISNRILGV